MPLSASMPRSPVAATARTKRISVRATDEEVADVDLLRVGLTASDYIRHLIHEAKARHVQETLTREDR